MAARRRYHHGDLRSALVQAATDLVGKHGAASFSLREAARVVGVDVAACYRHFRDRQDLLVAIAQRGFLDLAESFARERARAKKGARDQIVALGRAYLSFGLRRPAEFRVMFGDSGLHSRDPRLRLPEVERSAYEQLEDTVREWSKRKRTVDPVQLSLALWAIAHGVTRLVLDGAVPLPEPDAHALLVSMVDATLGGIGKR